MRRFDRIGLATALCLGVLALGPAQGQELNLELRPQQCAKFGIDDKASKPLSQGVAAARSSCRTRQAANGFLLPDPTCTPGAVNPTLPARVLQDREFTTKCVRNDATSEEQKHTMYTAYGLRTPEHNEGETQVCELDHLVSLELGGADTLDNIWPQCGPDSAELKERYFKQKDMVEDHLGELVRLGRMDLEDAQKRIAADWTQFLEEAKQTCARRTCKGAD